MNGTHEPRDEFVRTLEARVRAEFQRRAVSPLPRWFPQSRIWLTFATVVLVLVSMTAGGAAVAVRYQAQTAESRDMLVRVYRQRIDLAMQRLILAQKTLESLQDRVNVGAATKTDLQEGRQSVSEAEIEVRSIQLQLEEARDTGREPADQLSAPVVAGRDFVLARLQLDVDAKRAAYDTHTMRFAEAQSRVAVGLADTIEVEAARTRLLEVESALMTLQRKMSIRKQFVTKTIDGQMAELRGLEVDADARVKILMGQIDLSHNQLHRTTAKVAAGTAHPLEEAEARLHVQELEFQLAKANYDLALIRKQIDSKR